MEGPHRTIDERLDTLTVNNELMSQMLGDIMRRVDALAEVSARHERQWQRVQRVLRAAIDEALREDDQNG